MTWLELVDYAEKFRLKKAYLAELQEFFNTACRNDFFEQTCACFTGNFPIAEIEQRYDTERERRKFILLCALANYPTLAQLYRKNNYPDAMLNDISGDLAIWVDTYYREQGYPGLPQRAQIWLKACFTGQIKQFGRLQFDTTHLFTPPYSFYRQATCDLAQKVALQPANPPHPDLSYQDKTVNIHIPAGSAMDCSACVDSIRRMTKFMAKFQPDYDFKAVVCYSWLLDPIFQKLLNSQSNIVKFQHLGHLKYWPEKSENAEVKWRIWGGQYEKTPINQLPADNSLQRQVIEHWRQGGNFVMGIVIIFRDELPKLVN